MALVDRDVGVAVAATAAALSPRARELFRKGAVYGLAGALKAGDVVVSTGRGAARGVQDSVGGGSGDGRRTTSGSASRRRQAGRGGRTAKSGASS
jgi:hypothetical protein